MSPIWEAVSRGNGRTEGIVTLNQTLMRGMPSYRQVLGGMELFTPAPPPGTDQECVTVEPLRRPSFCYC